MVEQHALPTVEDKAENAEPAADATREASLPLQPSPDKKDPIKFKDAVGRKFSFPFELAATWQGMEQLIQSAFRHVEILGEHVNEGHYDLIGPSGEIILPMIWEAMIEPGWAITMHMWPLPSSFTAPPRPGIPPGPPPPSGSHQDRQRIPIEIVTPEVLSFPGGATVNIDHSLHLVLFPFNFSDPVRGEEIVIECKLSSPVAEPATSEEFAFMKIGFFEPSQSGTGFKQVEDSHDVVEASCQIVVESTSDYFFVLLVRRRRSEPAVELSVTFDFRNAHAGTKWIEDHMETTVSIDGTYRNSLTPFSWAITHGWDDALNLLLRQTEVLQNQRDSEGRSALSWAAGSGHEVATKTLLEHSEERVDERDAVGRTPLSWAAGEGHAKIVDLLLTEAEGVNPDNPDNDRRTPLSWAAANRCDEAVSALISHWKKADGGSCLLIDNDENPGNSPMFRATETGYQSVLCVLIEEQLRQSKTSQYKPLSKHKGWSLEAFYLHKAAENGWSDVVKLLLKNDRPDLLDAQNECTPLCVAAKNGRLDVVVTLLAAKADHNYVTNTTRDTILGLAIQSGKKEVVKALIDVGVGRIIKLPNAKGEGPKALAQRYPEIFNMIAAVDVEGKLADAKELQPSIDHEFKATIVEIVANTSVHGLDVKEVHVDELLEKPQHPFKSDTTAIDAPSFRWLHLPANNILWVECLMTKFYNNNLALAYNVLESERWVKRQHHGAIKAHHARFMRPHCQQFPSAWPFSATGDHTNLVLFMPFLHWDLDYRRIVREVITKGTDQPKWPNEESLLDGCMSNDPKWNSEKKLMEAYLVGDSPRLHLRRTLDQYYYHTLENTTKRDGDQVVTRYQNKKELRPKVITMVDQLWLWVLKGVAGQPDTVVSCFPDVGNAKAMRAGTVIDLDPDGQTNVLERVKHYLLVEPYSIQTAYDLAGLIAATCSRIYMDPGSTLSVTNGKDQWGLQFSELYQTEISDIYILTEWKAEEEAKLFEDFTLTRENSVADINKEIGLLSRIKDILDELNIMGMLFDDQRKVLRLMDDIVKSIHDPIDGQENLHVEVRPSGENSSEREDQSNDSTDGGSVTIDTAISTANRAARPIWGTRSDRDDFSMPLDTVKVGSGEIRAMIERAENAKQALTFLVDLKQKQNDVIDSKDSLEQGRIVLVFTITTIIFLPVSFMTSFLALDIKQFKKDSNGSFNLGYVSYIIFPVSVVISAVLIWAAFENNTVKSALEKIKKSPLSMWHVLSMMLKPKTTVGRISTRNRASYV